MKYISAIGAVMAVCSVAHGQEALNSSIQSLYPRVLSGHEVEFVLQAPKAREVRLLSDCLEDGAADMQRTADGEWHYVTAPLQSELYNYIFEVDSLPVLDPQNVYTVRDIARVTNMFIVPGGTADLYTQADVPHGSVAKVWYDSKQYGHPRRMSVYTPAGYEQGQSRYPVLYLLHGSGGDEDAWGELGRTAQILDNMIAAGACKPMIVVMPNGNAARYAAPGYGPGGMVKPEVVPGSIADTTYMSSFPEIVEYMDSHYETIQDASGRAVAGLSMGGGQSMLISAMYPDMFSAVGLFSPSVMHINTDPQKSPELAQRVSRQLSSQKPLYWIAIGADDFLYDNVVNYRKWLDANSLPYTYHESEGGHSWRNWRKYLTIFLPQLFSAS